MNKDSKPNQAYLWSNGVYHTKPESIATQEYANLIELQDKRIVELEAGLKEISECDAYGYTDEGKFVIGVALRALEGTEK